ncbi:MAG: tRNA lysidine(34) synthetase TilS [Crocinitomicaceae bacterium]|nr:tRNA lysidine(34) synthetase TilS [Crocinitomicaceae bacterium]
MHFAKESIWKEVVDFLEPFRSHTLCVGCSGGVDSMALLHFLVANEFKIVVAHVNYHKRNKESDLDMELVNQFCQEQGIYCRTFHYKAQQTGNFQELARDFRYQCFEELAGKDGKILLAHHADDQVETFFMNLMRQSGVMGLSAMPRIRANFLRPFIHLFKADLIEYAKRNAVPWREDASNQEGNYLRNKWRLEFIPLLEKENPSIKNAVLFLVNAFQQTQQLLEDKMQPITKNIQATNQLTLSEYQAMSNTELFELWRQLKQPANLFSRFENLATLPKSKFIETAGDFSKIISEGEVFSFIPVAKKIEQPQLLIKEIDHLPTQFSKQVVYLNPSKLKGALKVRRWQQGDKMTPLGVNGQQLVSKIIKDAKIQHSERERILVVHDDFQIHWVVGLKVGKFAISTPTDNVIWEVKLEE